MAKQKTKQYKNGHFKVKVKLSLYLIRHRVMKAYEKVEMKLHASVNPALAPD
jgi:predicted nucleotidyltransferase